MSAICAVQSKVRPVAVGFSSLSPWGKAICLIELVAGYILPITGIVAYFVLRSRIKKGKGPENVAYRFFPMAGVVSAIVWYVVECIIAGGVVL